MLPSHTTQSVYHNSAPSCVCHTLASLCGNIPGGMLVFFPSYVAMEATIQRWGGPTSSSEQQYGGRKSIGDGGRGAAFFAAAARKKQTLAKFVFPMVPAQFRSTATDQSSPWQRLLPRRAIVLEPCSTSELSDAISEYKRFIAMPKSSSGAILMGVCRGKISKGVSLFDWNIPLSLAIRDNPTSPLTPHVCLFSD